MQKPEQNTRFSALKYLFQISFRCWGVRKTPGFVICAKKGKNKWSSDETSGVPNGTAPQNIRSSGYLSWIERDSFFEVKQFLSE